MQPGGQVADAVGAGQHLARVVEVGAIGQQHQAGTFPVCGAAERFGDGVGQGRWGAPVPVGLPAVEKRVQRGEVGVGAGTVQVDDRGER